MTDPVIAQPKPCLIRVKAGSTYYWCSCGRSARQPFCDGSHRGTDFLPLKWVAGPQDEEVLFCGCKHTRSAPLCDGAHTNLPGGSPLDDPHSEANSRIPVVSELLDARLMLDGGCYVLRPDALPTRTSGALRYGYTVSADTGSQYQTQLVMEVADTASPVITLGACDVILFVASGAGRIGISGREFVVGAMQGLYVRPSEAFQLVPDVGQRLRVFAVSCPPGRLEPLDHMPGDFDARYPDRVVPVDAAQRELMGSRYFQVLVDKQIGSRVITQFIGHIPKSKAAPHRHLYEESITILSGEGFMWTETRKAPVRAGDVIFLPRKQLHSLEATSPEGIDVLGVICPGDNPSINYYD